MKIDYEELKNHGFIKQKQPDSFIIRLRSIGGNLDSDQLRRIADMADKYGKGYVHITTRQGVEIPWIKSDESRSAVSEIKEHGLKVGAHGPRIRTVMVCPGSEVCGFGIMNARQTGVELDRVFFNRGVPMKTKIAVTGCPNSCAKPQINDIGLVGAVEPVLEAESCIGCGACVESCPGQAITMVEGKPMIEKGKCLRDGKCITSCPFDAWRENRRGYLLYIGGKIGRRPHLGQVLAEFIPEDGVTEAIEKVLKAFAVFAQKGERIADIIERIGLEEFKAKYQAL